MVDAHQIMELADKHAVKVCVCHQNRFNPAVQNMRKALEEGRFGKLTHGSKPSFSGQNYSAFYYGVELDGRINYDKVEDIAKAVMPKIFVCGASAYAREIDFKRFKEIADSVGAILFADIAHIAGLVTANIVTGKQIGRAHV